MQLSNISLNFDNDVIIKEKTLNKFGEVYRNFVQKNGKDVVRCIHEDGKQKIKKIRSEAKTLAAFHRASGREEYCKSIQQQVESNPKEVSKWATKIPESSLQRNPFEILGYHTKSSVQERMERDFDRLTKYGSFAYSCSCGAGKTIAGINLIYKLKLKTLIVSSRNAVNDQWKGQLEVLYPGLKIVSDINCCADILIITPQYLSKHLNDFDDKVGLIIFDEVHSQLSEVFLQVLLLPFLMVIDGRLPELPYMIALSATYPDPNKLAYKHIKRIFGQPAKCIASITSIPVYVYDYYDHYTPTASEKTRHRYFDSFYKTLTDAEAIENACDLIDKSPEIGINIYDEKYCGIVMTYSILSSIQTAKYLHERYNVNVVIIRTVDQPAVLLKKDVKYDYSNTALNEVVIEIDPEDDSPDYSSFDTKDLLKAGVGERYNYSVEGFRNISIVVSTVQRVKEGFSIQHAIWGICTKFVWSAISRVQILGRIRRNSNNEELNKKRRIMLCYSAKRPSNVSMPPKLRKGPIKWSYETEYEKILFDAENYIRI